MSPHLVHASVHAPAERPPEAPLVDFFGIGAPKCRTSWLARCLDEHPQVTIAEKKEPNFLVQHSENWTDDVNGNFLRDWSWYADQFAHAGEGDLLGDFSVTMMCNLDTAPDLIQRYYPNARFFVLLRDPVRRIYSDWWHGWGRLRHVHDVPRTFEKALDYPRLVLRSQYHKQLSVWMDRFPRDRFLVLIDRDLDDAERTVRSAYEFLGVDPDFVPAALTERVNAARARRGIMWKAWRVGEAFRRAGLGRLVDAAKRVGVEDLLDRADRDQSRPPPIKPETERALRNELLPDIERLEDLLNRDLSHWKPA